MKTQPKARKDRKPNLSPKTPLTPQQLKFVAAYAKLGIGSRAAIEAGYSPKTADAQASRLLTIEKVKLSIAELAVKSAESTIADNTKRRQFWSDTMFDPEVPWVARLKASELLGKTAGDFLERVEHSGQVVQVSLNLGPPPSG